MTEQSEYAALVALIRTELELVIKPLRDDLHEMKDNQYTREMIDEKLKLRDERIGRLESGWASILTKSAAILAALWTVLSILRIVHF